MKKIHPSKISYYARNKRLFLSNARYKSMYRIKTKPTFTNAFFNTLIKEECSKFLKENSFWFLRRKFSENFGEMLVLFFFKFFIFKFYSFDNHRGTNSTSVGTGQLLGRRQ